MRPTFPLIAWLAMPLSALAAAGESDLTLASGEFPPYVSEQLPQGGVTSMVVREAFAAAGLPAPKIVFLPWKRGYSETEQNRYAAAFPYARDAAREKLFLYSDPLHLDHFSYFVRKDDTEAAAGRWQGKRLCLPLGWTTAYVDADIHTFQLQLERPPALDNCLKMLSSNTVDLVSCNDFVASYAIRQLYGAHSPFVIATIGKQQSSALYLIVSRQRPDAEQLLRQFNQGLTALRRSGRYQQLLQQAIDAPASP
ncbi:substrate-binding periplasmic protein [Chromobacterium alticapitis]|uniref:Amino acid ABC transporter substrate-binding protein n=1 Tax=Chromobacterium alticapitis TaxID=2073169 RepID=A0A2S5DIC3_9NEIS|nr:transporter substrate-binding domain-containing protein [Chromobacterium alticapitis]POZ62777.1 amino acid ABC transporter substrate-binding protein [Chromobacterium alticapitis]